jgi:hypothetical protein
MRNLFTTKYPAILTIDLWEYVVVQLYRSHNNIFLLITNFKTLYAWLCYQSVYPNTIRI